MNNRDLAAAREYHAKTKHSLQSVRSEPHSLDWANQPMPFKVYTGLEPLALPPEPPRAAAPALSAVSAGGEGRAEGAQPPLETLARIFFLTAGITKRIQLGGGPHYFRAAACTGALYHIELYLVCGEVPGAGGTGLPAGVYHLAVHDYAARRLRPGDFRAALARAAGLDRAPPASFVFTSTYWRNAWKYRARAYRHCFWDSGTMLANLLAAAAAFGAPARVALGFADGPVNALLGLEAAEEAALAIVELGARGPLPPEPPAVPGLRLETTPLSARRVDYPAIREVHAASSLADGGEAAAWRRAAPRWRAAPRRERASSFGEGGPGDRAGRATGEGSVFPLAEGEAPADSVDEVILRRGSARRFERRLVRFEQLSAALRAATHKVPADFLPEGRPALNELFLIVNAVEGIPPGAYYFDRGREALVLLREGNFRREAGVLGLEQSLAADAAVNVYFLSDLGAVLEALGNRGYRAAQLEAGIMGGKLYLAAYAQRLAASGLTFYDDEVTSFFGPQARGKEVMFLVLLGHRKRGRVIG